MQTRLEVVDDRGVELVFDEVPMRIVSLVPSTTETLFALGLGERVVGVTRFCVHPAAEVAERVKVGGTKDLEPGRLDALKPDLVIANAEENSREMFAEIEARWPLYVAFPKDVGGAVADLRRMGRMLGVEEQAEGHALGIEAALEALEARVQRRHRVAYLIWRKPWMVAGADTFIGRLLSLAGMDVAPGGPQDRYLTVEPEELAELDEIWLSSEPFPFAGKHVDELVAAGIPRERIRFVDGELCSWHGVRMKAGLEWLAEVVSS